MTTYSGETLKGPVHTVVVEVAEFIKQGEEFVEGPRVLAESIWIEPSENRTERVVYYSNGLVHSRHITTQGARGKESVVYRYTIDGALRDKWIITYDVNANPSEAHQYNAEGQLLGKHVCSTDTEQGLSETADYPELASRDSDESFFYEFDGYGNWIKEIKSVRVSKVGISFDEPIMVTFRKTTYYQEGT